MADQTQQQARPPPQTYPSPHSYPSPSMQPTYAYPPPQGQQSQEPYRGSPTAPNMSLPPLNLPPIRLQDGQQQPPPPAQQPAQNMGSPLHPPQHGMPPQYYGHAPPPQGQQMGMGASPHIQMRYQIPPQGDGRIMSGGRHKKEIKRRTKTGCLTCRKRRIKCDEAHPVCRNCQKSKRECLGYDPIFKQQPGPAQIQPAPNTAPHPPPVPVTSPPVPTTYASQVPQGYAPAVTSGYVPAASAAGANHQQLQNFNTSAIDPALAATDPALHGQATYNGAHGMHSAGGAMGTPNAYAAPPSEIPVKARRLVISELFPIGNHNPPEVPARNAPIPQELDDEFAKILANDYCQGLDAILETTWFSTNNNAFHRILADQSLHEEAIFFVETVKYKHGQAEMASIFSQEARLIWRMLGVCKNALAATNGTNGTAPSNPEEDLLLREVRARFDILEALLTNQNPQTNPLHQVSYTPDVAAHRRPELDFWNELGNFVIYADSDSPTPGAADYALSTMRTVLNAIETRDALYSIAIARRIGNRLPGFPTHIPPPTDGNPDNDINKLNVAMGFISYESRSGSQQVTARICDMAMLSWSVSRTPASR